MTLSTLELPTSATAAIILAGFQQFGLQPGQLLFATQPKLVWGMIASLLIVSLLIANVMLLLLNLPPIRLWVKLLTIPSHWLFAGILLFATRAPLPSTRHRWNWRCCRSLACWGILCGCTAIP